MKKDAQVGTAAVVRHGVYQYVRLPKEFQSEGDQVQISKDRTGVILKPLPTTEKKQTKKSTRQNRVHISGE